MKSYIRHRTRVSIHAPLLKSRCLEESRTAFHRPLGRISDISPEDTLELTIFEKNILKFQGILFFEKIARV